jgi:hypothetical protein
MTFHRQAPFFLGAFLLLSIGQEGSFAQGNGQGSGPVQIQGIPGLSLSPIRLSEGGQPVLEPSALASFSSPGQTLVPAPVFQEPPSQLEPALPETAMTKPFPEVAEAPAIAPDLERPSTQPRFRLGGVVQATYDSNILLEESNAKSDIYFILAPTLALGGGAFSESLTMQQQAILQSQSFENADLIRLPSRPFYYLSYIPSYTAFVDHTNLNSFDNDVSGAMQIILRRLALGAFVRFQTLRAPDIDVGTRTREQWTSARAYALYTLSDRTQLNADIFLQDRNFQNYISSFELWNEDWLDYRYSSKTSFGAGVAAGLLIPSAGPQEYYGRVQARATWNATRKIVVAAKVGLELRTVSGGGEKLYPVFGLEGRYAINSRTSLGLSIYQYIQSSADQAALIYVGRGLSVGIQEKILDRYQFGASVGYTNTEYDNAFVQSSGAVARTDNFVYADSSLRMDLSQWVDSQVGVEFRKNRSSETGFSFNEVLASWAVRVKF